MKQEITVDGNDLKRLKSVKSVFLDGNEIKDGERNVAQHWKFKNHLKNNSFNSVLSLLITLVPWRIVHLQIYSYFHVLLVFLSFWRLDNKMDL